MLTDLEEFATSLRKKRHPTHIALAAATLAITAGLAAWMFTPPSPPAIRLRQVTRDTENKTWPVVSDGSRLYFFSFPHERKPA